MRSSRSRAWRAGVALAALLVLAGLRALPERFDATPPAHACAAHLAFGVPELPASAPVRLLCRDGYALAYRADTRTAAFVGERLVVRRSAPTVARLTEFAPDPALPSAEAAQLSDYRGSGYDRGHLAPAADFADSARLMRESFYLSNVVPQDAALNRGAWAELERHVRRLARERGVVYVLTGPVNDTQPARIGAGVAVPRALYKVVIDPNARQAVAWLMPNRPDIAPNDWDRWRVSVREVETATGIEFNPALAPAEQERLETSRRPL
jgi:endonuclease G